jgi:hypothetical protein
MERVWGQGGHNVQALLDPVTDLQSPDSSVDCNCPNQSPAPLLPGGQRVARCRVITLNTSSDST